MNNLYRWFFASFLRYKALKYPSTYQCKGIVNESKDRKAAFLHGSAMGTCYIAPENLPLTLCCQTCWYTSPATSCLSSEV